MERRIDSPLLTEHEACEWLRLTDPGGPKDPAGTLRFYRQKRLLRGVRIGRRMRYHVSELERFCVRLMERETNE